MILLGKQRTPARPPGSHGPTGLASRWLRAGTLLVAAVASVATSAPRYTRAYPEWTIAGPSEQVLSCAWVRAFVARSGKQGVGLGIEVQGQGCEVQATARLRIGSQVFEAAESAERVEAASESRFLYVPIPFDNNASWNDGERQGALDIAITAGGERRTWTVPVEHRFEGHYTLRNPPIRPVLAPSGGPGPQPVPPRTFATPPPGPPGPPQGGDR